MARYRPCDTSQKRLIPVDLKAQLSPGTLEFAIHTLVEERLDTSIFDCRYRNDLTGCAAYDPKMLLKIVLLAYSRGIVSSRKIERACRENVTFMALSTAQVPDHSTLAAFVSSMKDQIHPLFVQVLLVCEEMRLLGGTTFALDGVKLPSNAAKECSGTFEDLRKKKEKIERKVREKIEEQLKADKREAGESGTRTDEKKREQQIEKLRRKAEKIERFLEENTPKPGKSGRELKSNTTDNDSAKMLTSHGAIQGYNGQGLVDSKHQVIVSAEAFGSGQDNEHLAPLVDLAKENLQGVGYPEEHLEGKVLSADANYHSEPNLKRCAEEKLDAYIPDVNFRKRDPRFASQGRHKPESKKEKFGLEDFRYDAQKDEFICPAGRVLKLEARNIPNKKRIYNRYEALDCSGCALKDQCIKSERKKVRRYLLVTVETVSSKLSKQMIEKIDTEQGRKLYAKRLAIVEPVFANLRTQKRLDRFTLRSKVNIQWLLYCMVHNVEKIAHLGCLGKEAMTAG